jgi:hypothetical protein
VPRAAAERREARRPASWAGDLRRSEDRPSREAGHGVRRLPHQRLSALCSPRSFGGGTRQGRPPLLNGAAERWLHGQMEERREMKCKEPRALSPPLRGDPLPQAGEGKERVELAAPAPALSSSTFAPYITPAVPQGPAMAINGRRNKPIGPGGSTRRIHHRGVSGQKPMIGRVLLMAGH